MFNNLINTNALKKAIINSKTSYREITNRISISIATINRWVNNKENVKIPFEDILNICNLLGLPLELFIINHDEAYKNTKLVFGERIPISIIMAISYLQIKNSKYKDKNFQDIFKKNHDIIMHDLKTTKTALNLTYGNLYEAILNSALINAETLNLHPIVYSQSTLFGGKLYGLHSYGETKVVSDKFDSSELIFNKKSAKNGGFRRVYRIPNFKEDILNIEKNKKFLLQRLIRGSHIFIDTEQIELDDLDKIFIFDDATTIGNYSILFNGNYLDTIVIDKLRKIIDLKKQMEHLSSKNSVRRIEVLDRNTGKIIKKVNELNLNDDIILTISSEYYDFFLRDQISQFIKYCDNPFKDEQTLRDKYFYIENAFKNSKDKSKITKNLIEKASSNFKDILVEIIRNS